MYVGSGSGSAWIRNFCLDPDPDLGKFKSGSGSGMIYSGSATLLKRTLNIRTSFLNSLKLLTVIITTMLFRKKYIQILLI